MKYRHIKVSTATTQKKERRASGAAGPCIWQNNDEKWLITIRFRLRLSWPFLHSFFYRYMAPYINVIHWPSIDRFEGSFCDGIWYFDANLCCVICFQWCISGRWLAGWIVWLLAVAVLKIFTKFHENVSRLKLWLKLYVLVVPIIMRQRGKAWNAQINSFQSIPPHSHHHHSPISRCHCNWGFNNSNWDQCCGLGASYDYCIPSPQPPSCLSCTTPNSKRRRIM